MQRHSFDPKVFDYTWKQNRLAKDKESMKKDLLALLAKKPKKQEVSWIQYYSMTLI